MNKEELILESLIHACISFKANDFIPYLLEKNVKIAFPNKMLFYRFLKMLINCAKKSCIGNLHVEETSFEISYLGGHRLCFYDKGHKYALINLEYKIENNTIIIDAHPF